MTRDLEKYLPPDEIARISRLELRARKVVEGFVSGLHRSPYFGQSLEFVQHREYVPGDDTRRIDWKLWSRSDRYYLKQFEEDTNVRVSLLVDGSESMQFGSGQMTKFEYAQTIAAALAMLILKQNDSVGVTTFDSQVRSQVPTSSRHNHLQAVLGGLTAETAAGRTDIRSVLRRVAETLNHRSIVVLISDLFCDREELFRGLQLLKQRKHEVLIMHVMDDQELDFQYSGTLRFEGMEDAGRLTCDPAALRAGYMQALEAFLETIRRRCAGSQVDYKLVRTSENLDAALAQLLNARMGAKKR
ncbi:MAG: DUF58 domain-containing protein [Planctomycetaceae bacterium]|nr:DUF58 domain-containing protein [Planctomycetaceae bacterium]